MRDKVAIFALLNNNFQVHKGSLVLRLRVFKQRLDEIGPTCNCIEVQFIFKGNELS
jgi:hypothetical protein